jgi:hypothetical protein
MATRKSNEDGRGTERGGAGDEHPGSYVQVVGTPRRRKSSAKQAAVPPESSTNVERVGPAAAKYQNRMSDPPVSAEERERAERTFASPKKAVGPLGMEPAPTEAAPTTPRQVPGRESLKKTAIGMGPDMRAQLERYAAEQAEAAKPVQQTSRTEPGGSPARTERVHSMPARSASEGRVRVVEVDASQGHIDTEGESESDATSAFQRSEMVVASQPAPAALAMRAPSEPPKEASLPPPRGEMASVFDARVSIRPSDPVKAEKSGPSWGMVVGIAVLSSIIASAGVVAMQELFASRRTREVPGSVHVARRSAVAQREPAAPTVEPAVPAPVAPVPAAEPVAAPAATALPVPAPEVPAAPAAQPEAPVATQIAPAAPVPAARPARSPAGVKQWRPAPRPAVAAPAEPAGSDEAFAEPAKPAAKPKPKNRLMGGLVESEPPAREPAAASEEELPDNPFAD